MKALGLILIVAAVVVDSQDIPLDVPVGLDFSFGGSWLRAGPSSPRAQPRAPREDSTTTSKANLGASGRGPAYHAEARAARAARRAFATDPACNFTSCCYLASPGHTVVLAASDVSQAAGPLACGGATPADGTTAPCHTPVEPHTPLLLALRTRMQLSLHALSTQLDRLVASRPRAWLEQQLAELQQLLRPAAGSARLALGPAQSAGTRPQAEAGAAGASDLPRLHTERRQGHQGPEEPLRTAEDSTAMGGVAGQGADDALDGLAAELALQGASPNALARLRRLVRAQADYAERARAAAAATAAVAAAESAMAAAAEAILSSTRTSGGPAAAAIHADPSREPAAAAQAIRGVAARSSDTSAGAQSQPRAGAWGAMSATGQQPGMAPHEMPGHLMPTLLVAGVTQIDASRSVERDAAVRPPAEQAQGAGTATLTTPPAADVGPLSTASASSVLPSFLQNGSRAQASTVTCACPADSSSTQHTAKEAARPPHYEPVPVVVVKLLTVTAAGALCCAALAVRSLIAATEARKREAAEAAGRLEGVIEGNRRQAEALAAEYEAQLAGLQARHAAEADRLQSELSSAQLEVQQLRTNRDKCVRLAAASQRLGAAAAVQMAAKMPALQQQQATLSEILQTAVSGWQRQGAAAAAALARCKAVVGDLRKRAAAEKVAAEAEARRVAEAAQVAAAAHEAHVAILMRRFQQELEEAQRRHVNDQRAAQEAAEAVAAELAALRRRHGANVRSWLALKSWVALKMTDVTERAGRLAADHRAQAAAARAAVQDLQGQLAAARAQLAAQVGAAVAARGAATELTGLLAGKDADILELEGRLGGAEAALESQRQQAGALTAALTATEESLVAARAESAQLSTELHKAQAAIAAAEGRSAELLSANQLLDAQVKQFTDMAADLARIQETYVAPHQARVAALEAQVAQERAAAAAAAAARAAELAAASEDLAEARRECESLRRVRAEVADRLERRERELRALQVELAELSRREEEGLENALCAVRQRDRDHEVALQQLLLPLPADTKAAMLAQASSAGCATPSPLSSVGGSGGGVPGALASAGFATPLTGGSGMGAGSGSSASGVRGALGLGSLSMPRK